MIRPFLSKLARGEDLAEGEMVEAMEAITAGEATPAQIGAFLMGLRIKGLTVDELVGAARVMRARTAPIRGPARVLLDRDEINIDEETILDTTGTGGSGTSTFNVSTATAFVVAACGVPVAKHGTRAVSSLCGSADVLTALGVELDISPSGVEDCLRTVGIAFFYEPLFHSTMRHVAGPRKQLGVRTLFNLVGPLANPAGARHQVLGTYSAEVARLLAEALQRLGTERAMVVHGEDGMDEITVCGRTLVLELKEGGIDEYTIRPEDFGMRRAEPAEVRGGDARENAEIIRRVLAGEPGAPRDVVLLNVGAALYVAGVTETMAEGVERAARAVDSGEARAKLDALVERTRHLADRWCREL